MLGCLAQALLSELAAAEEAQAAGEAEARTLRSRLSVSALAAAAEGEVSAALRADLDRERARSIPQEPRLTVVPSPQSRAAQRRLSFGAALAACADHAV